VDVAAYLAPELIAYTYNAANEISSAGFVYDVRGRRTQDPSRTYTWDAADRLTQIVTGATTTMFDYTALGDCAKRTVGGVLTEYFYAYSIANKPIVAEKRAGAYVRFYVYTPDGRLLYLVNATNNQPAFYHFNRVGTTLFLTDASGNVADTYGYTPYGQMVKHNGTNDQPFTFVGEYGVRQEGDIGIYQMRARYYDPQTIRFLSRDPFGPNLIEPKSINPYAYAAQNPLSFIDPTGLYWVDSTGNSLGGSVPAQSIAETFSNGTIVGWVDEENGVVNWKVVNGKYLEELGSTVLLRRNLLRGMFGREIGIKVGELTTTANQGKPLDPVVPPGKEFFTPEVQNIVDVAKSSCSCKCDTALAEEQNDLSALGQNAWVLIGFVALMALVWMGVRVTMGRAKS
jgi:RHS repeat-associated protein